MKKQSFLIAGLLVLSSMAAAQVARAQETMVVDIPFAFVAGRATPPAGENRVPKLGGNLAGLLTHCLDVEEAAPVIHHHGPAKEPQNQSKLVFNRDSNHPIL